MFTDAQIELLKTAVKYLADAQTSMHGGIADDLQELYDLLHPEDDDTDAPVEAPVAAEEPAEEDDHGEDTSVAA